jgi:hypothetical protein
MLTGHFGLSFQWARAAFKGQPLFPVQLREVPLSRFGKIIKRSGTGREPTYSPTTPEPGRCSTNTVHAGPLDTCGLHKSPPAE